MARTIPGAGRRRANTQLRSATYRVTVATVVAATSTATSSSRDG